jgi:cytoskeleton protein RodZ
MKPENIEMEEQALSLGQSLHAARSAAGLSIGDISARLKLTESQIVKLEQDDYLDLGPITFVRGYVRAYSQLLGLDVEQMLSLVSSPSAAESTKKMQSFSRRTEKEASDNRLMIISYLILAVVIGSSGLWWWQTSTETVAQPQPTPSSTLSNSAQSQESSAETGLQHVDDEANEQVSEPEQTDNAVSADSVDATASTLTTEQAPETPVLETQQAEQVVATQTIEQSNVSVAAPKKQENSDLNTVIMRFSDDSWVEIFDATEERIAFGIKKAGYIMTVQGKAPFSVVLGKHQVVEVELDGQLIDLSALPRNRLAKFKLPLAE